jgi:hypothetical protein
MRIAFFTLVIACICSAIPVRAQEDNREETYILMPLSSAEEAMLQALPELKLPPGYANRDLPYMVDNSTQIYMRPAYQQAGLCCGQASCIGYNFTYEMSRERDLNAGQLQNQYPTHFAWNFMNGGDGYYGVSYLHSIQILKEFGMPNAVDYGGTLSYGGPSRWMSGYNEYYNGMHNRINNAYQIQGGTPEGLLVIKHWLHSHLEDSPVGGIASFYAQHMTATSKLATGTPEAGKYVLTTFGGSPNHAMTIVGYNDSIRWDYNSDGQYTNNLDINGDNVVNMKDWEIGGFKMVQSYGGVPNWGDLGYAYMMYKTIADNLGSGGIWNHCVHVLDVKETYDPKLTAKITLKHSRRDMIKVSVGLANSVYVDDPQYALGFPIYDYHGGNHFMQGGTTEADKTIEFGFDLSKLLSDIELDQNVKFFLQVVENDPANAHTGEIINFSIYDHTAGGIQVVSPETNVPLVNDDTTTITLMHNINFNRVSILDESLPPAPQGEYYSYQLTGTGGTEPYLWEFDKTYEETFQPAAFPQTSATQLTPSNNSSGYVTQQLGFDFPFYDSSYSSITVHVDGYLMFNEELYPFPYYDDDKVQFNITRHISPCLNRHQEISSSSGGGIWYEGNNQSATIRWKTRLTEAPSMVMNYAVRLYPDGTIKFFYGDMDGLDLYTWMAGIGDGDGLNYQYTTNSFKPSINPNTAVILTSYDYPAEMELSTGGLLSGTPQQTYGNEQITFKVTDNNFIHSKKTLTFSSTGVIVSDSIVSGGDEVIAFGETAWMTMSVMNVRPDTIKNATMTIHISDPYITVADSTENLGNILPGQLKKFSNAFHFDVAENVPNEHLIVIESVISSGTDTYETTLLHYAYAPIVLTEEVVVDDENGRLDAGDTTDIVLTVQNAGGIEVTSLYTVVNEEDPYITINQNFGIIPLLEPGQSAEAMINLVVANDCPPGHAVDFTVNYSGDGGYTATDSFTLVVGLYLENYETGDFTLFNWGHDGNRDWTIETSGAYEGSFCARSGIITHSEESVLKIDMNVLYEGMIGFYKRTSCESDTSDYNNFDYLCFKIDGNEMGRWDSITNWTYEEFPVTAGIHRFEWVYHKDDNVSFRNDAAWIDEVTFPSAYNCSPVLSSTPGSFEFIMQPDEPEIISIILTNPGAGDLNFTADIAGINPSRKGNPPAGGSRSIEGSYLVCNVEKFHAGVEYNWNLRTYNAGADNEWIKQVYVYFPAGVEMVATTDFIGGSGGPMIYDGPFGNGVTGHWFGEDPNGWGVVHMGESASCDVSVIPQLSLQQDLAIDFEVKGEVYGGTPHDVFGSLTMRNLGPVVPWLSLDNAAGTLEGGATDSLMLTLTTAGMEDGDYQAWILINDNFGHEQVIPVNLTLDTYLGGTGTKKELNSGEVSAYPNPFLVQTSIIVNLPEKSTIRIEISNIHGQPVRILEAEAEAGIKSSLEWDGKDDHGNPVHNGIYPARIVAGTNTSFIKLIKTN